MTGPAPVMRQAFAACIRQCWTVHALAVMESDPLPYYNLWSVLPHTWLYVEANLITTYEKSGPLSYTLADNEQLVESMIAAYGTWFDQRARGDITVLLDLTEERVREALHIPGYVRGNLAPPRIPVIRADTMLGGSVDVFTGLKPTIMLQDVDCPPVIQQGFQPVWYHSTAVRLSQYHWYTDELFMNITVISSVIVLNLGPVLCGGVDHNNMEQQDVIFPVPPPGIIRIPLASVPLCWSVEQTIRRTTAAIRRIAILHERNRSRSMRRAIFSVLQFTRPELTTLVLSDCPLKDFMHEIITDLNRAATETLLAARLGPAADPAVVTDLERNRATDPELIFAATYTATPRRYSEIQQIRPVFPTVHCV